MESNEFVNNLEKRIAKVEESLPNIKLGINEVKILLAERPKQEELKNSIIIKDVTNLELRIKKIEDTLTWLWRTIAGAIILEIIAAIIFVIKVM